MKTYTIMQTKLGQYLITLPSAIVEGKGWGAGTQVTFRFGAKGEVMLEEMKG